MITNKIEICYVAFCKGKPCNSQEWMKKTELEESLLSSMCEKILKTGEFSADIFIESDKENEETFFAWHGKLGEFSLPEFEYNFLQKIREMIVSSTSLEGNFSFSMNLARGE